MVEKGSVTRLIRERGGKYSPIINSVKQTLQTTQTINTATQQTNFLIRVEFLGCYTLPPLLKFCPIKYQLVLLIMSCLIVMQETDIRVNTFYICHNYVHYLSLHV